MSKITDSTQNTTPSDPCHLIVIDGANAIYRAFFAIPGLRAPDGRPTNAIYGFATMLRKVLREERPSHIVVAMDPPGGSFRSELYPEYKAGRDAQPEDLTLQFPLIAELCEVLGVAMLEVSNFEADDVIATLVETAPAGSKIGIISTDKDLMQLVGPNVTLLDTMKGSRVDTAAVEKRFGVPPSKLLDVRALVGDPSDNIPGVKGIGEKGAAKLIQEWGRLDALLDGAEQVKAKRAREALLEHADDARLSRRPSTLRADVPLDLNWDSLAVQEPDRERLRELYQRFGFTSLLNSLDSETAGQDVGSTTASSLPQAEAVAFEVLRDEAALDALVERLADADSIALHPVVEGAGAVASRLLGLAIAGPQAPVAYIPLQRGGLFDREGISSEALVGALRLIGSKAEGLTWIGHDSKAIQSLCGRLGLELSLPSLDVQLAGQMLDSTGSHDLSVLAQAYLERTIPSWEEVAGRGAKAKSAADLGVEVVSAWASAQASVLLAIAPVLRERLATEGLIDLFDSVERPLTAVLSRMELAGVRIDEAKLQHLSVEYEQELTRIESEIFRLAGEEFLVSSPRQLQVILFE